MKWLFIIRLLARSQSVRASTNPTTAPTFSPSISFQPTIACPAGYQLEANGTCLKCNEGKYSDQPNRPSCQSCEPWTWTLHGGSSSCDYTTARNSVSVVYPSLVCGLYLFLSLWCYGLLVYLGGSPGAIVTIVLIATDQVTDLLYSWYSLFAQPYLLYLSFFFCLSNLVASLIYLLFYLRCCDLFVVKWLQSCSDAYDAFDRRVGRYEHTPQEPIYSAWVLHSILGLRVGKFFPFSLIIIALDLLWIVLRIFIILVIFVCAIISQIVFLLIGVALCTTKLMSIAPVYEWFWTIWNPEYLETHPQVTADDATVVYNALVLVEVFSECLPQIVIQLVNTAMILGGDVSTWPVLTILSLTLSLSMIISILYHFYYEHNLLLIEDPSYTSFEFRRIPKFDLFVKFTEFATNRRTINNNHGDPAPVPPPPPAQQQRRNIQPVEIQGEEKI